MFRMHFTARGAHSCFTPGFTLLFQNFLGKMFQQLVGPWVNL